jgi:tubulin-specific chaperone D
MIFLKPRLAPWRYQRGSRSLAANLSSTVSNGKIESVDSATADLTEDDEDDVPEEIELVLEEILHGLRDKNREVQ